LESSTDPLRCPALQRQKWLGKQYFSPTEVHSERSLPEGFASVVAALDEMPLVMAVRAYGQDIISFLLDQGANVNSTFYNLQPLLMAVQRELDTHESVIGLLVQRGADSTSRMLWEIQLFTISLSRVVPHDLLTSRIFYWRTAHMCKYRMMLDGPRSTSPQIKTTEAYTRSFECMA
jgi:hypothetical protein